MEKNMAATVCIQLACMLAILTSHIRCELFTSTDHMNLAISKSHIISSSLEGYIKHEEARIAVLKHLSSQLSKLQDSLINGEDLAGNPINFYRFAKFYGDVWDTNMDVYKSSSEEKALDSIIEMKKFYMPSKEDLNGAIDGLVRLQRTYHIHADDLANGSMKGFPISPISVSVCHDLTQDMVERDYFRYAAQWCGATEKILMRPNATSYYEEPLNITIETAKNNRKSIQEMIQAQKKFFWNDVLKHTESMHEAREGLQEELREIYHAGNIKHYGREVLMNIHTWRQYEELCRGDNLKNRYAASHYNCWYTTHHYNPLLVLQPAKIELLNEEPLVLVYHDIVSDKDIAYLRGRDMHEFERSETVNHNATGENSTSSIDERISRYTYFSDESEPSLISVYQKLEATTQFKMFNPHAEVLQVGNYGIGGQYDPHLDYFEDKEIGVVTPKDANRLITMLIYLSDVKAGGATVFPRLNIRIPPKKGSAAFWFNLDDNLVGDDRTLHAGCPVLLGSKWIANKWIHNTQQDMKCYS